MNDLHKEICKTIALELQTATTEDLQNFWFDKRYDELMEEVDKTFNKLDEDGPRLRDGKPLS